MSTFIVAAIIYAAFFATLPFFYRRYLRRLAAHSHAYSFFEIMLPSIFIGACVVLMGAFTISACLAEAEAPSPVVQQITLVIVKGPVYVVDTLR